MYYCHTLPLSSVIPTRCLLSPFIKVRVSERVRLEQGIEAEQEKVRGLLEEYFPGSVTAIAKSWAEAE